MVLGQSADRGWHRLCGVSGERRRLMTKIERREDVSPQEGEREYGDVTFADPVNKKYPLDTDKHIRAAWSYINHKDNAAKYDRDEVETIKKRIMKAAKDHGIEIDPDTVG
jgi:hypothetical protein